MCYKIVKQFRETYRRFEMEIKFEWERLDNECQRAKVIGGWIVRSRDVDDCNTQYTVESMVFVSDVKHEWKIK